MAYYVYEFGTGYKYFMEQAMVVDSIFVFFYQYIFKRNCIFCMMSEMILHLFQVFKGIKYNVLCYWALFMWRCCLICKIFFSFSYFWQKNKTFWKSVLYKWVKR